MSRKKLLGLVALGGVLSVGVVVAASLVLHEAAPQLVGAVQAATTLCLVLITGVYAYLTYRLVAAQENYVRRQSHEKAAAELSALVARDRVKAERVGRHFPLQLPPGEPLDDRVFDHVKDLAAFANGLSALYLLLPVELAIHCLVAARDAGHAVSSLSTLEFAMLKERLEAMENDRPFDWGNVRNFYDESRAQDLTYPDWAELLAGEVVKDAMSALDDLEKELRRYMMPIPDAGVSVHATPRIKAAYERARTKLDDG